MRDAGQRSSQPEGRGDGHLLGTGGNRDEPALPSLTPEGAQAYASEVAQAAPAYVQQRLGTPLRQLRMAYSQAFGGMLPQNRSANVRQGWDEHYDRAVRRLTNGLASSGEQGTEDVTPVFSRFFDELDTMDREIVRLGGHAMLQGGAPDFTFGPSLVTAKTQLQQAIDPEDFVETVLVPALEKNVKYGDE